MNWSKLKRKLEREFKRSPGKTAVLLALLPIAVYFIGPLLWQKQPQNSKGVVAPNQVAITVDHHSSLPGVTESTNSAAIPWHELADAMAADTRMKSAALVGLRNPFRNVRIEEPKAETTEFEVPEPVTDNDSKPEDYGLHLTATIVGARLRMATINGRQYREKSTVKVKPDAEESGGENATSNPAFVIRTVEKKHVVLEREGRLYQLKLER